MSNTLKRRAISILLAAALFLGLSYSFLEAFSWGKTSARAMEEGPSIEHTAPAEVGLADETVTFTAMVTDSDGLNSLDPVKLYYRVDDDLAWQAAVMAQNSAAQGEYSVTLNVWSNKGGAKETKRFFTDKIEYYIEATDALGNTAKTEEQAVSVEQNWGETSAYDELPYLLITEMTPETAQKSEIGGGDRFEFMELYNNSESPIDLSGFEFRYMNKPGNSSSYALHSLDNQNVVIQPRSTFVVWISTQDISNNGKYPAADMQAFYYDGEKNPAGLVELKEDENLGYVHFSGMPNGGSNRGWSIYTKTGELVVEAYYNKTGTNTDVTANKGILFRYPTDGTKEMQKVSANEYNATPGLVLDYQVPKSTVDLPEDTEKPVIEYTHESGTYDAVEEDGDGVNYVIEATITDDSIVNNAYMEYRVSPANDDSAAAVRTSLVRQGDTDVYRASVDYGEFIRQKTMTFKIVAQDITGKSTQTQEYTVAINSFEPSIDETAPVRANIGEGDFVAGVFEFTGTSQKQGAENVKISVDGEELSSNATSERYAYFVYEVIETDYQFKNGVTVGDSVLKTFEVSGKWMTYTVRIPMDLLAENGYTIGLHAGNRYSTVYDREKFEQAIEEYRAAKEANDTAAMEAAAENFKYGDDKLDNTYPEPAEAGYNLNRDDYKFRDVRLILSDGTVLYDANPDNGGKFAEAMRDVSYSIGDGSAESSLARQYYFRFDVPSKYLNARTAAVDTEKLADGAHTFTVSDGQVSKDLTFYVDNTAPEVRMNFRKDQLIKGTFELNPVVSDAGSGVTKIEACLDGAAVSLPCEITSGHMDAGTHTLTVTATDAMGNVTTVSETFQIEDERPTSSLPGLADGAQLDGIDASLSVGVSDPGGDDLHVTFYQGYRYDATSTQIDGYWNEWDVEPPETLVTDGETSFTESDYSAIAKVDGQYVSTYSEQLPYHRFSVSVPDIAAGKLVNIHWYGKSLPGRRVTLYAWNLGQGEWEALDSAVAGDADFELEQDVPVDKYRDPASGKIEVMIQDEVASEQDSFSFAWISDTQYYTQRNGDDDEDHVIYRGMVDWVLGHRAEENIKYVIHTGDIVNKGSDRYQWDYANAYMRLFEEAEMPYGVLAGNHDVNFTEYDYTWFGEYFGEDRFADKSYYGGSYENNRGHYDLISANGIDFIILYMGWGIGDEEIEWMNETLQEFPNRIAILNFHEYLNAQGGRTEEGEMLYQKVVLPNENVQMVLSGHIHSSASKVDYIDDDKDGTSDRKVLQMLSDYQGRDNTASNYAGGDGFLRLLHFDTNTRQLSVTTHSPWLEYLNELCGEEKYDAEQAIPAEIFSAYEDIEEFISYDAAANSFVYSFSPAGVDAADDSVLAPKQKAVCTDAIFINYYASVKISEEIHAESGTTVSADWNGLAADQNYFWYVTVADDNGGAYRSKIYAFETGAAPKAQEPEEGANYALPISLGVAGGVIVVGGCIAAVLYVRSRKQKKQ